MHLALSISGHFSWGRRREATVLPLVIIARIVVDIDPLYGLAIFVVWAIIVAGGRPVITLTGYRLRRGRLRPVVAGWRSTVIGTIDGRPRVITSVPRRSRASIPIGWPRSVAIVRVPLVRRRYASRVRVRGGRPPVLVS